MDALITQLFDHINNSLRKSLKPNANISLGVSYVIKGSKKIDLLRKDSSYIVKSLSGVRSIVVDENNYSNWDVTHINNLPVLFQEKVVGNDLRAHVIGKQIFCKKSNFKEKVDYRYDANFFNLIDVKHLESDFVNFCLSVSQEEKNKLLGIDFIQHEAGYVVLEANPSPGWSAYHPYNGIDDDPLFVWVGLSQFIINASNAYIENKVHQKQSNIFEKQIDIILSSIDVNLAINAIEPNNDFKFSEIIMRDGLVNKLSLEPGLYRIHGGNATGKSTLMNIILGYDRDYYYFKNNNLLQLVNSINTNNIRVIERDVVVFKCFHQDFNSQVFGPLDRNVTHWQALATRTLHKLLSPQLSQQWFDLLIRLENEYFLRQDRNISSGEKIILSVMRFFCSWNEYVKLLIVDECDAFLDYENKQLFTQTLSELSKYMAIYISFHSLDFDHDYMSLINLNSHKCGNDVALITP